MRKVSLYIDEDLWVRFKEAVLRKHGTLRKLSSEVESLIRESLIGEEAIQGFAGLDVEVDTLISPKEIKENRPRLRGPPSEAIIREMRGRRIAEDIPR